MIQRYLIDTNILVYRLSKPKRLSSRQLQILRQAEVQGQTVAISGMTLVELSFLMKAPRFGRTVSVDELFDFVQNSPHILVLPISVEIAREAAALRPILIEPADCIIAATARVHGLRLLTADQRIIAANLVSTIE